MRWDWGVFLLLLLIFLSWVLLLNECITSGGLSFFGIAKGFIGLEREVVNKHGLSLDLSTETGCPNNVLCGPTVALSTVVALGNEPSSYIDMLKKPVYPLER